MTGKRLATYVRCCNSKPSERKYDCMACLYRNLEAKKDHPEFAQIPADITLNGEEYWVECDIDRILNDVIEKLEAIDEN